MRITILAVVLFFITSIKAQTILPLSVMDYAYSAPFANNLPTDSASAKKKWTLTKYAALSTSYTFFKGGNAGIIAAPIGLQLNRKITENIYAFANVSVAPAYVNFNSAFNNTSFNKNGQYNSFRQNSLGIYSSASLGLMYINNDKTFSISGSISVEKSSYPLMPAYQTRPVNANGFAPANR